MLEGIISGIIQGIFEWLPVSSQGVITIVSELFMDYEFESAIALGIWLHSGTSLAALIIFREDLKVLLLQLKNSNTNNFSRNYAYTTFISAIIGVPILLFLGEINIQSGSAVMVLIGLAMTSTSIFLKFSRVIKDERSLADISIKDSILIGTMQGLSAIPGLSRSGVTVAVMLGRGLGRKDALRFSFMLSIPVSLGAALVAGIRYGLPQSTVGAVGAFTALLVGLVSIKALLVLSGKINFSLFMGIAGIAILLGGLFQIMVS
ncbi:MAG: hypothetical protein CL889_00470 [Dehalococcoidia bacterium]|nr:hypothetical protein [Dehalococcoidia bacterium]|tara:strand:+ start:273 stop:1058 length:786 start_codon:yes stop_codon:yes gene_type:complete